MISEFEYNLTPDLNDRSECDHCDSMDAGPAYINEGLEDEDWNHVLLCLSCVEKAREDGEEVSSELE